MTIFRFEAVDANGQTREGILDAATPRQARDQLRAQGLLPVAVSESHADTAEALSARSRAWLRSGELALLTRQLATLLTAGLPLEEALAACAAQTENQRAHKLLDDIRSDVLAGHALAATLGRYPRAFPPL